MKFALIEESLNRSFAAWEKHRSCVHLVKDIPFESTDEIREFIDKNSPVPREYRGDQRGFILSCLKRDLEGACA